MRVITEKDKSIIIHYAQKYNVSQVFLFGSSIKKDVKIRKIRVKSCFLTFLKNQD